MSRLLSASRHAIARLALVPLVWFCTTTTASAAKIVLKDGRTIEGNIGETSKLAENPLAPRGDGAKIIVVIDDGLKRTYVPQSRIAKVDSMKSEPKVRIKIAQSIADAGAKVHRLGPIIEVTPFDEHGVRKFTMAVEKGSLSVVQGITDITPVWTKVQGLNTKHTTPVVWDSRIATSSIPLDTLRKILYRRISEKDMDTQLTFVRLLLQMDLLKEAQQELEATLKRFPDQRQSLTKEIQQLRQYHARRIIDEIKLRRSAHQHALAYSMLDQFPTEDITGEILEQVREMTDEYKETAAKAEQFFTEITAHVASIQETEIRKQCEALLEELKAELSINTIDRMAPYFQLRDDNDLSPQQKLSLAFTGWLLGANQAHTNFQMALALVKARTLVRQYVNEPIKVERNAIFSQLQGIEGASPPIVAQLIANMNPPLETPDPSPAQPGYFRLQTPIGIPGEPNVTYYVQLPPSYDPHLRYPTIVTLNGVASTPEQQIDWWAGDMDNNGNRIGQATRHGYITIAVEWLRPGQQDYEYSAREHASVLASLRDACRRFSVDTDRVFLTGHSMGANAVWDIGLSHPDWWAGVMPIVGVADRYCSRYWKNAKLVPFYVLCGEMDGDKIIKNAETLDRYMLNRFDLTMVEYMGRGHEDFYEDILNMFDWMAKREKRNFFPKEFEVSTMRSWDNYFWWVEAGHLPEKAIVEPADWPPAAGALPVSIRGRMLENNSLTISSGNIDAVVWLSPEMVDFAKPIQVRLNNKVLNAGNRRIDPDLRVLLDDVRERGDRIHPFWAKVGG